MESRCVYILKWDRYYVGSTNDIDRRIGEHKKKWYTAKRIGVWQLIKTINCETKSEARQLERKIKESCHPERYI